MSGEAVVKQIIQVAVFSVSVFSFLSHNYFVFLGMAVGMAAGMYVESRTHEGKVSKSEVQK